MQRRYKILFISSLIFFSYYYAYDMPSALNTKIKIKNKDFEVWHLALLYSAYAMPNIFVPLFFIQLKLNDKISARILAFLVFVGQAILTCGIYIENFYIMLAGRFVFGIGCESFSVIQNKIVGNAFRNRELSTSMALLMSTGRLGTILNFILTPYMAEISVIYSAVIALSFTGCGFILSFFLRTSKRMRLKIIENEKIKNNEITIEKSEIEIENNEMKVSNGEFEVFDNKIEKYKTISDPIQSIDNPFLIADQTSKWSELPEKKNENIWDVRKYPATARREEELKKEIDPNIFKDEDNTRYQFGFLVLVGIAFLFAGVWAPFYNVGTLIFQVRYDLGNISGGSMMAILECLSIVMVIIIGTLVDYLGSRIYFMGMGGLFLLLSHILIFFKINRFLVSCLLGMAGPLISCYWPCAVYLNSPESLGRAFAILYSVNNISYTFSPIIISYLAKSDNNYSAVEIYLIIICSFAILGVVILKSCDSKQKLGLNRKSINL